MTCKSGAKRGGARQRGFLRRFGFVYKANLKDPVGSSVRDRQVPQGPLQVLCRSSQWCAGGEAPPEALLRGSRERCWKGGGKLGGDGRPQAQRRSAAPAAAAAAPSASAGAVAESDAGAGMPLYVPTSAAVMPRHVYVDSIAAKTAA